VTSLATVHRDSSPNWWTPPEWWTWVCETLDAYRPFDPCPDDWDGSLNISGLETGWQFPCYVNHPGSKRGAAQEWWNKAIYEDAFVQPFIWCGFNLEQLWRLSPSPLLLPGWLVLPKQRVSFIWGGPDTDKRKHGERQKSPANSTFFWTTVEPKQTPVPSLVLRTGAAYEAGEE
jgi:hypothetical protein